ncbi:MAG: FimD/PapC C-terminal domain-containing protein [Candidatus Phlomobacter fragariae]
MFRPTIPQNTVSIPSICHLIFKPILPEGHISVKRGKGYLLHFPIKIRHTASVVLTDQYGKAISLASVVTRASKPNTYVGWEGLIYLEELKKNNLLTVSRPEGKHCQVSLQLPSN